MSMGLKLEAEYTSTINEKVSNKVKLEADDMDEFPSTMDSVSADTTDHETRLPEDNAEHEAGLDLDTSEYSSLCQTSKLEQNLLETYEASILSSAHLASESSSTSTSSKSTSSKKNNFSCPECDFTCKSASRMDKHLHDHRGGKRFYCDQCNFSTKRKGSLNRHKMTHTDSKPYSCEFCDFTTKRPENLKVHMLRHDKSAERFSCDRCTYSTVERYSLQRHFKMVHTDDRPYVCSICDFSFKQSHDLKKHLMTHTGERPYKCDQCDYACTKSSGLKSHKLTHLKKKPLQCPHCEYNCSHPSSLASHMGKHGLPKLFTCDWCDYTCRKLLTYEQHMKSRHPEKDFKGWNSTKWLRSYLDSHELEKNNGIDSGVAHASSVDDKDGVSKDGVTLPEVNAVNNVPSEEETSSSTPDKNGTIKHNNVAVDNNINEEDGPSGSKISSEDNTMHYDCNTENNVEDDGMGTDDSTEVEYTISDDGVSDIEENSLANDIRSECYACELCHFKCEHPIVLQAHMIGHPETREADERDKCPECSHRNISYAALKRHFLQTHYPDSRIFKCSMCNYSTHTSSALERHKKINHNPTPRPLLQCPECSFSTKFNQTLKEHMFRHSGVYPFHCEKCNFKCYKRGNLQRHLLTVHNSVKHLQCQKVPGCTFKCKTATELKAHLREHAEADDASFACGLCTYTTSNETELRQHMEEHALLMQQEMDHYESDSPSELSI